MTKCNEVSCEDCPANKTVCKRARPSIEKLATALLEERAKPKVWDFAPEWANVARVRWFKPDYPESMNEVFSKLHTRELPKTRAGEIADEVWREINKAVTGYPTDIIRRALTEYAEELEGRE